MSKLQQEIRKARPFDSIEEEVHLNLLRTADVLGRKVEAVLKPLGLTPTQYNVLRILRGAGAQGAAGGCDGGFKGDGTDADAADGLACGEIADRMITRDPDITRLLD